MLTPIVPSDPPSSNNHSSKFQFSKDKDSKVQSQSRPVPGSSRNPATKPGTFHGRKFIESGGGGGEKNMSESATELSSRAKGKKMNSNLNDLDKLLDNDAVALLNMRKELSQAQEQEVEKARLALLALQKECDSLKILNLQKEHEIAKYEDQKNVLVGLVKSQLENSGKYTSTIEQLNDDIYVVEENIAAENRTKNVLIFMIKRLETEIIDCKSKSHFWTQQLQQAKAELCGIDGTLRLSKHELSSDERQVELLSKTVKGRTEQRLQKMNELQSLVLEGEASVLKIQQTFRGSLDFSQTKKTGHSIDEHFPKSDNPLKPQEDPTNSAPTLEDYDLTKEQIFEIIERYNSRMQLIEKLTNIQNDLTQQLKDEKQKKIHFDDLLDKSNHKLQLLASNRQIYQEVDMKDAALATARKEGDDCREKDQRLRKGIEGLRRSIPRFLQKVNKDLIPDGGKPVTADQLPDVVHKLDDEVNKLIKLIGERMLKDATAEDISNMTASVQEYNVQTTENTLSETSRLHKLPGYHRLQKQLFTNLMSAVPDSSEKNIRVQPVNLMENNEVDHTRGGTTQESGHEHGKRNVKEAAANTGVGTGNDYIDRTTVKNISKLVVTQNEKALMSNTNHWNGYGNGQKGKSPRNVRSR